jgi:hypothetical protein
MLIGLFLKDSQFPTILWCIDDEGYPSIHTPSFHQVIFMPLFI